MSYTLK